MKQELFEIIKHPKLYKQHRADHAIRAQLVRIKEALDLMDQYAWDLGDPGVNDLAGRLASNILARRSEIQEKTMEIAEDLDKLRHNTKETQ